MFDKLRSPTVLKGAPLHEAARGRRDECARTWLWFLVVPTLGACREF